MIRYIVVSVASGMLFGIMDGLINANSLARRLFRIFEPIARKSMNIAAGLAVDIVFGFVMAGVFLLLQGSLPGRSGAVAGLAYGLIVWFFRVAMQVASQWVMFKVPVKTLLYTLVCGLGEMLALGLLYGLSLQRLL